MNKPSTLSPTTSFVATLFFAVGISYADTNAEETSDVKSVFHAVELNHLSLNIEKPEPAELFFRTVFGMTPVDHGHRGADKFMHFQQGFVNLRPANESSINHYCVSIKEYDRQAVYQMSQLIETEPYFMGRSVHCFDPDRFNIQIEESRHGWGRINGTQLTDADKGVFKTVRIHHVALDVTDLEEAKSFYAEVFGTKVVSDDDDRVLMSIEPSCYLELLKAEKPGINHYCFAVEDFDVKEAKSKLNGLIQGKVTSPEPGVIRFLDPNGIPVEVTSPDHQLK